MRKKKKEASWNNPEERMAGAMEWDGRKRATGSRHGSEW